MIFFLSSLPSKTFKVVEDIFQLYREGKIKKNSVPRSQKGIDSIPELKESTFKPFRGLDPAALHQLLSEIRDKTCTIGAALDQCKDIKTLQKFQLAFGSFHVKSTRNLGSPLGF